MAVTKTKAVQHNTNTSVNSNIARGMHVEVGTIAFDSSYPTGGEALTFEGFTPIAVMVQSSGGYVFSWDATNGKVLAYFADYNAVADGALIQFTNAGNLSALTAVQYIAIGF